MASPERCTSGFAIPLWRSQKRSGEAREADWAKGLCGKWVEWMGQQLLRNGSDSGKPRHTVIRGKQLSAYVSF
jgi:hypothetical protein